MYERGTSSLDRSTRKAVLGRLGSQLALVYDDTLHSTLPPALQALIDRLDQADEAREDGQTFRAR